MEDTASFEIETGILGPSRVVVNGQDVLSTARSIQLRTAPGQPTSLVIEVVGQGSISGQGIVYVHSEAPDLASRIRELDPKKIDEEAMSRLEWGSDGTLTNVILQVISEKLSGT